MDTRSEVAQSARKFIQLLLVGDEAFFRSTGNDSVKAQDRLWEIGNYVNSLYKQLGANVVTVRAIVLSTDPYTLANKTTAVNSLEMLDKFMTYRMQFLGDITHTVAQLVSGLRMTGSDVGLAHLGKFCQFALGGGVNSDTDLAGSAINVAVTLAHELGHNLGMNHDEDDSPCPCPDAQGCIMKAVGGEMNPMRFSTCSVNRYLEFTVNTGLGYCMEKPPDATIRLAGDPARCGNRIVEPGEDCDCGLAAWCNNTCCNPGTCKFSPGAVCASGQCCNVTNCALIPRGAECRAARGTCDLPELCNGSSEWCPEFDDHLLDGTQCAESATVPGKALAHCYSGECSTRDRRCQDIFNGTNYRDSPEPVYNFTMDATNSENGYCSYRATAYSPLSYTFVSCTFANRRCGTLYCTGTMIEPFPVPKWKSMAASDARSVVYTDGGGSTQESSFARLDLRPSGFRDPGMVPNGAECGSGMMCVNSRCLTVVDVRSGAAAGRALPNCNGNGRWTQSVQCYCNSAYRPPDCLLPGAGGSVTNQPAFSENATTVTTTGATIFSSSSSSTGNWSTSNPFESTTLDQKRDDFWLFVGIGIAAAIVFVLLLVGLALLLWFCCWRRRRLPAAKAGQTHLQPPRPEGFVANGGFNAGAGPPAHLAEFYDSLRATKGASVAVGGKGRWPPAPNGHQAA